MHEQGHEEATGNDAGTVVWVARTAEGRTFRARPTGSLAAQAGLITMADPRSPPPHLY